MLVVFFASIGAGSVVFPPSEHALGFFLSLVVLVGLLIAVLLRQGRTAALAMGR